MSRIPGNYLLRALYAVHPLLSHPTTMTKHARLQEPTANKPPPADHPSQKPTPFPCAFLHQHIHIDRSKLTPPSHHLHHLHHTTPPDPNSDPHPPPPNSLPPAPPLHPPSHTDLDLNLRPQTPRRPRNGLHPRHPQTPLPQETRLGRQDGRRSRRRRCTGVSGHVHRGACGCAGAA